MAENTTNETVDNDVVENEVAPTRLQKFVMKHPKISKVVAATTGTTALIGAAVITSNLLKHKDNLASAGEHMSEAVSELSSSVSPDQANTEN